MNLNLTVDILKVMAVLKKHRCQRRKEPYKIASCFLHSLAKLIESQFLPKGYEKVDVKATPEKTTFRYRRGEDELSITQLFIESPLVATLHVNVKREELKYVEALLKITWVHEKCISLPA